MMLIEPLITSEPLTHAEMFVEQAGEALACGDLVTAREFLCAALRLVPRHAELTVALGHLNLESGDVDEALSDYLKAARLDPNLSAAHAGCALAYQRLGHTREAEAALELALALNPMDTVARHVRVRFELDAQSHDATWEASRQLLSRHSRNGKDCTCE